MVILWSCLPFASQTPDFVKSGCWPSADKGKKTDPPSAVSKPEEWTVADLSPEEKEQGISLQPNERDPPRPVAATSSGVARVTVVPKKIDLEAERNMLQDRMQEFKNQLNELKDRLSTNLIKPYALGEKGVHSVEEHITHALALVECAHTAAQAVILESQENDFVQLGHLIDKIIERQKSLESFSDSPQFKLLKELAYLLTGLASMLWTLMIQIGLIAATSSMVMWAPFAAGLSLILIRAAWLVKLYLIDETQLEDKRALKRIYQSLVDHLEGIKKKMIEARIAGLADQMQKLLQQLNKNVPGSSSSEETSAVVTTKVTTTDSLSTSVVSTSVDSLLESVAQKIVETGVDETAALRVTTQKLQEALEQKRQRQVVGETPAVQSVKGSQGVESGEVIKKAA